MSCANSKLIEYQCLKYHGNIVQPRRPVYLIEKQDGSDYGQIQYGVGNDRRAAGLEVKTSMILRCGEHKPEFEVNVLG